jgi:hypothetical protein
LLSGLHRSLQDKIRREAVARAEHLAPST